MKNVLATITLPHLAIILMN